jgi:hypothetical protein
MKNILKVGNRSKTLPAKIQKPICNAGNLFYLFILINFYALGSGSAFLIRIRIQLRIRIQDSQINADPPDP